MDFLIGLPGGYTQGDVWRLLDANEALREENSKLIDELKELREDVPKRDPKTGRFVKD